MTLEGREFLRAPHALGCYDQSSRSLLSAFLMFTYGIARGSCALVLDRLLAVPSG